MNDTEEISSAQSDAEECLLGSIIMQSSYDQGKTIREVMTLINPEDFRGCVATDPPWCWTRRARIFYAMTKCDRPHEVNVAHKLVELNILENKDCAYLRYCCSLVPCSLDYMDYARTVKEYSVKRQAQELAKRGDLKGLRKLSTPEYKPLGTVPL